MTIAKQTVCLCTRLSAENKVIHEQVFQSEEVAKAYYYNVTFDEKGKATVHDGTLELSEVLFYWFI